MTDTTAVTQEQSFYDRVGGHATFGALIEAFFDGIRQDPELSAMYEKDWDGAEQRLLMFFEQYWGGPMGYSRTRGAPMLKMRHMPYRITEEAAGRWAGCMHRAIDTVGLDADDELLIRDYVERACLYLVNADD